MEGMTLEKLKVIIEAQTGEYIKKMKEIQNKTEATTATVEKNTSRIKNAFGKIAATIAIALSVTALFSFGKSCMELGSNLSEVQNVVDVTFGSLSEQVNQFAKDAVSQFGLSELAAKKYTSTMGAMLKSMGFTGKQAANMGIEMTSLAGDMASFYNLSGEDAFAKIRAGISGETEPLKQLGINLSVANLEAYAFSQGMNKSYNSMTQQEQAMLRYSYLLSVTADAQGDFARTSSSWANQTRVLSERFNTFKATIGQGLINVFTPVLKVMNIVISRLQVVADAFQKFSSIFTGNKIQTAAIATVVTDASSAAGSMNTLTDSTDAAGDSASAAAKKFKGLMGFDEVNSLSKTDTPSTAVASTGVPELAIPMAGTDTATSSWIPTVDFGPLTQSFGNLKQAVEPILEKITGGLSFLYEKVLKPFGTWTIQDALPAFFDLLSGALDLVNAGLEALEPLGSWLFDNFLSPIAAWTGGVVIDVINGLADALKGIADWIDGNQKTVEGATIAFGAFVAVWEVTKLLAWIEMSGGLLAATIKITAAIWACTGAKIADKAETVILTAMYAKDFVVSLVTGTIELAKQAAQWVINTALKTADVIATAAMTAATIAWNVVCAIATAVTTALGAAIAFLTSPIGIVIVIITALIAVGVLLYKNWDLVKEKCAIVWEAIKNGINTAINAVKDGIANALDAIKTIWDKVWGGLKETVVNIFNGIWGAIKGVINSILGGIEGMANGVVSGVNKVIAVLNNLSFKIPDWVPEVGGMTWGMNIPTLSSVTLPRLATGGVIDRPTAAIIGEAGKEAVVPLENNTGWMDKIALKLGEMITFSLHQNSDDSDEWQQVTTQVYLDSKTLVEQTDTYRKRRGYVMA